MRTSILLVVTAALLAPAPAGACHNATVLEADQVARRLDAAEQSLLAGTTRDAMRGASWALRVLRGAQPDVELFRGPGSERRERALRARAHTVLALAVVRREGRVDRRRWVPTSRVSAETRRENVEWALRTLESQASGARDVAPRARLAEALAQLPERRDEARRILVALADRDLVPDAWGYRVLAELSDQTGDRALRDRAIALCQARAGELASAICPRLVAVR